MCFDRTFSGKLFMVDAWEKQDDALYVDAANADTGVHLANMARARANVAPVLAAAVGAARARAQLVRAYSADAARTFGDASLDFVYLDARHARRLFAEHFFRSNALQLHSYGLHPHSC